MIIQIPRSLLLTLQEARQGCDICQELDHVLVHYQEHNNNNSKRMDNNKKKENEKTASCCLRSPNHCFMSIFMIIDQTRNKNKSKFSYYYNSLPNELNNMPIFWSQEDLMRLRGSKFLQKIEAKKVIIMILLLVMMYLLLLLLILLLLLLLGEYY